MKTSFCKISSLLLCAFFLSTQFAYGQWEQLNNIPFVDHHSNGFGVDGKAYIIQGSPMANGTISSNRFWEYDPLTDDWIDMGFVPGPARTVSIGDDMDGKYYFGFGNGQRDLWVFDPADNSFTELPSCPGPTRSHPAFVAHNNKIFMGSGSGEDGDLDDWWVYDMIDSTWTQKEDIPGGNRHHPFQFGLEDAIYVGGGHRENWIKYDIIEETWTEINNLPGGRVAGTQFSYEGNGFALSGDAIDHGDLTSQFFMMYDAEMDQWFELPFEPSMSRWAPSSFLIENEVYFFGGLRSGENENGLWKYNLDAIDCLVPAGIGVANIEEQTADLIWETSPDGPTDTLQWRELGTNEWNTVLNPQSVFTLSDLMPCTDYEFRLNVKCSEDEMYFTLPRVFRTFGCGSCIDYSFCDVNYEFYAYGSHIERVAIADYENQSGNNEGYAEFTDPGEINIMQGSLLRVEVEPAFSYFNDPSNFKIWIDYNANGTFNFNELVVDTSGVDGILETEILIPLDVELGLSRIRFMSSTNSLSGPCEGDGYFDGEVEDYCITIVEPSSISDPNALGIQIFPNPAQHKLYIKDVSGTADGYTLFSLAGQEVDCVKRSQKDLTEIDVLTLEAGLYILQISDGKGNLLSKEKVIIQD